MDFQKLVETIGLPAAFVAARTAGKECGAVPNTFSQWLEVFCLASSDEIKTQSFREITIHAQTFEQWHEVYLASQEDSEHEMAALKKMLEFSQIPKPWSANFLRTQDNKLKVSTTLKIVSLAQTFEQLHKVLGLVPYAGELWTLTFLKMVSLAQTFEQWLEIYRCASFRDNEFRRTALRKMGEFLDPSINSGLP